MNRRDFLLSAMGAATMALVPALPGETTQTFSTGWIVTEEIVEPGLYGEISERYAKALARSMMQTREVVAAKIFMGETDELEIQPVTWQEMYRE